MSQPPPVPTFTQAAAAPEAALADTAFTREHLRQALTPLGMMAAGGVAGVVFGIATSLGDSAIVLATGFAMLVAAPSAVRTSRKAMAWWAASACFLFGLGNRADLIREFDPNVLIAAGALTALITAALAGPCVFRAPPMMRAVLPTSILTPVLAILAGGAGPGAEPALAFAAATAATAQIAVLFSLVRPVGVLVTNMALAVVFLFASLLILLSA